VVRSLKNWHLKSVFYAIPFGDQDFTYLHIPWWSHMISLTITNPWWPFLIVLYSKTVDKKLIREHWLSLEHPCMNMTLQPQFIYHFLSSLIRKSFHQTDKSAEWVTPCKNIHLSTVCSSLKALRLRDELQHIGSHFKKG